MYIYLVNIQDALVACPVCYPGIVDIYVANWCNPQCLIVYIHAEI
jgi:hypothetical protein